MKNQLHYSETLANHTVAALDLVIGICAESEGDSQIDLSSNNNSSSSVFSSIYYLCYDI